MPSPDLSNVDDLCRLAQSAQQLGCTVRLDGATAELRELLDLAGVSDVLFGQPPDIDWIGVDPQ